MKIPSCSLILALALGGGACSTTHAGDAPAVTSAHLSRARNLVKTKMRVPFALAAAQGLLGPPTLVDGDGTRWMMAGDDRCTELRIVTGSNFRVQGVALFSVTPVAGTQYQACMAAVGQPVEEG